jgi:hypothetical protein
VKDILVLGLFVVSFATLVTVHVAIAGLLILRARPRWRGVVALLIPPLAPIWAYREGFRRSAALWLITVVACASSLIAASL